MKKILKTPGYQNHQGYNGLNMDAPLGFTSSVGHLLPVDWDFLQPGDKVRLGCRLKTRTSPLISAAMADIEENVRWFFVPISQIYKPFEQTFNGIQDFGSDFYSALISNNRISDGIPTISLGNIVDSFNSLASTNTDASHILIHQRARLLECLGVPIQTILQDTFVNDDVTATWRNHSVNLLPLLSYHKIWYDYFRDTDRIPNDPDYYNADSSVNTQNSAWLSNNRLDKLMTLHNVPCKRDVMNNVFVSPLFGESGIGGDNKTTLDQVNQWLSAATYNPVSTDNGNVNRTTPTQVRGVASPGSPTTTATFRAMFATEKLLEITRRARKHYDAQTLAHFGVNVPMGIDGEAIEIGHHKQSLLIGDVISTSDTYDPSTNDGSMLGEIGGKGYANDANGGFTFEAKTHGVIMAVYYARPSYYYYQQGLDKKLMYSRVSDFPRPEFENLGMQPVFFMNRQLTNNTLVNSFVLNWEYRYSEVKTKMPRAILGLSRTLDSWIVGRSPRYGASASPSGYDYASQTFYVQPEDINQILEMPFSDKDWLDDVGEDYGLSANNPIFFDSDPLIHELSLSYVKASKISTYGLSDL